MKNKMISSLIIMFLLSLSLTACGKEAEEVSVQTDDSAQSTVEEQTADEPSQEPAETAETAEPEEEQVNDDNAGIDVSLEGQALLASLSNSRPDKFMISATLTSYGMTSQTTIYYDDKNSRTETDVPGMGKSVLISLPDENVMYSYTEGSSIGIKMTGTDDPYADEGDFGVDEEMISGIVEDPSENIVARADTLNGEDVVYVETTESEEDMGEVLIKLWYSAKYSVPLKYEMYVGDQKMATYEVTEIADGSSIDSALFQPPSDVDFQESAAWEY